MDWTKYEVEQTVDAYFEMLHQDLNNERYNKSGYRRKLAALIKTRSHGAIEKKHQNISAVLSKLGLPYIKGYVPLPHYQQILEDHVIIFLKANKPKLETDFQHFSEEIIPEQAQTDLDFSKLLDEQGPKTSTVKEKDPTYSPIKINYLKKEQDNRLLGQQGEELVMDYEKWRLDKEGKKRLAEKIEWISRNKGDGTGYDILSKNLDGSDRYIEVKTTKLSKETPIFLSRNEMNFALKEKNFFLYRVFNWGSKPQLFIKSGPYESFCKLQPVSFKGIF